MEPTTLPSHQVTAQLFTEKQVGAAALLAGPLPAGILLYLSHKRLGEDTQASYAMLGTILFTVLLFGLLFSLPDEWTDNRAFSQVLTALLGGVMLMAYELYLKAKINRAIANGAETASNWTVAFVTLIGLVLTLVFVFSIAMAMPPYTGESMEFGALGHEIYYDEGTATEEELQLVAEALTASGYFSEEQQVAVRLEMGAPNSMLLMSVAKDLWEDPEIIEWAEYMSDELSLSLHTEMAVVFEDYKLDGTRLVKMIE